MAFFKFRGRGAQGSDGRLPSAVAPTESVEVMRRRARHRLLGAGALVLLGVIGFPMLFDTQPRPVPVDIPIDIPDRNKVKPLALPATPPVASSTATPERNAGSAHTASTPSEADVITEAADGTEITSSKPVTEPVSEPAPRPASKVEHKAEVKPERKLEPKAEVRMEPKSADARPTPSESEGARARALLEGRGVASSAAAAGSDDAKGRYVVQVGAFADPAKAAEVRQKLEKAGLKTYTHVAQTAEGARTRVRLGPFSTRAEADRAASRVKGLSMPAAILTL